MKSRLTLLCAASALVATVLAGCSMASTPSAGSGASAGTSGSTARAKTATTDLSTANTSLGTVVVDGKGQTAYYYDNDTANSGRSSCTGVCATLWPAITSSGATPTVSGMTAPVGTITDANGGRQVTIDGRPIYTFAGDKQNGDVNGEGVDRVWYAISPAGKEITAAPTSSRY